MKTDEEELKKRFRGAGTKGTRSVPGFDSMWDDAERLHARQRMRIWRIAAVIILAMSAGIMLYVNKITRENSLQGEIATWQDPTRSLLNSETVSVVEALSDWNSPTEFLLPANNKNIK